MAGLDRPSHILILVLVLVVLFGAKRLPDSAKSIAKSLKIFKDEIKSNDEVKANEEVKTHDEKKTESGPSSTAS
jgi:sec-independent protein translocase protein TatA